MYIQQWRGLQLKVQSLDQIQSPYPQARPAHPQVWLAISHATPPRSPGPSLTLSRTAWSSASECHRDMGTGSPCTVKALTTWVAQSVPLNTRQCISARLSLTFKRTLFVFALADQIGSLLLQYTYHVLTAGCAHSPVPPTHARFR
jgi:hypothetical protein